MRSVDPDIAQEVQSKYPQVEDLWKIDYLGGWKRVTKEVYGPQGIFTQIYEQLQASR